MAVGLCAAAMRHHALCPEEGAHKTYVCVGDGDLMEGVAYEAISLAGHLRLSELIVLFDDNGITIDGPTHIVSSGDVGAHFVAENWHVCTVNGHDSDDIYRGLQEALADPRPSLIRCRTEIGHGAPTLAGTSRVHGGCIGPEERCRMQELLHWPYAPFEIPEEILEAWRMLAQRNIDQYHASKKSPPYESKRVPDVVFEALETLKKEHFETPTPCATRASSSRVLQTVAPLCPVLIGGSADLTTPNCTKVPAMPVFSADTAQGQYLYYGIREHGMAAFMNGLALYGHAIPYGGTFLVFSDYMRPALRLGAMMHLQVLYIFTHDSIGVGEDGPTHQPVEHLMSLRLIPNLYVFRPADTVETCACWASALHRHDGPSALVLTRQKVPPVCLSSRRSIGSPEQGGYLLEEDADDRQFTLLATGSEVSIALEAKKLLNAQGFCGAVVSLPCWELFDQQETAYKRHILGETPVRVSIEAGSSLGWEKYVGEHGHAFGINHFGLSGRAADLFTFFGLTAQAISQKVVEKINQKTWGRSIYPTMSRSLANS
jgi:transketolase